MSRTESQLQEKKSVTTQQAPAPFAPVSMDPPKSDGWNEEGAIKEAQKGRREAFDFLYRLHSKRVYNVCLGMTRNPSTAEDLTQNAFMLLLRKINSFRGDAAFSSWLYRITMNVVLMYLRGRNPPAISLDAADDPNEEREHPFEVGSRDKSLEGRIDRLNLERAISQLASGHRKIFILHDVMGYAHREIAGLLQCSIGNSRSQLSKAHVRLRSLLSSDQ